VTEARQKPHSGRDQELWRVGDPAESTFTARNLQAKRRQLGLAVMTYCVQSGS